MVKQDALIYATQLEIERRVRDVARSGILGSAGDYHAEWEGNSVWASWDDVSGGASVTMPDGTILYSASEFGRSVQVYRHGKWAHRLVDCADSLIAAAQREAEARRAEQQRMDALNFTPIDY